MARRAVPLRVVLVAALVFVAIASPADRLELRNGDVVSGEIVSLNGETVTIRTSFGTLQIPRREILRGEFGTDASSAAGRTSPSPGADASTAEDGDTGRAGGTAVSQPDTATPTADADTPAADGTAGADAASDPDDPLFHFPLDGDTDDRSDAYDLVNNGMIFAADRDGAARSALRSSGGGTYLSVAADRALNTLSEFTLAFDVQLDQTSATRYLASKWARATGETAEGKFTIQTAAGGITVFLVDPEQRYHWMSARGVLDPGQWHHVAVCFGDGTGSIFVDGAEVATRSFAFTELATDDSPLLMMTAEAVTADRFGYYNAAGSLDDIRLYDRVLSDAEIASIAVAPRAR